MWSHEGKQANGSERGKKDKRQNDDENEKRRMEIQPKEGKGSYITAAGRWDNTSEAELFYHAETSLRWLGSLDGPGGQGWEFTGQG